MDATNNTLDFTQIGNSASMKKTKETKPMTAKQKAQNDKFEQAWRFIFDCGYAAGMDVGVEPMIVSNHVNPLDDNSRVVNSYFVASGVCGFGWVQFKGNTPFGKWALATGLARKAYPTGLAIYCHYFGQSMQRKEAWAHEVARLLRLELNVEATGYSRMD